MKFQLCLIAQGSLEIEKLNILNIVEAFWTWAFVIEHEYAGNSPQFCLNSYTMIIKSTRVPLLPFICSSLLTTCN